MIKLIKTEQLVPLMNSSSYKERFIAEYILLKQKYEKLKVFNTKIEAATRTQHLDNGVDEPIHDCPAGLLREQQAAMGEYLHLLEVRAVIEGIDLQYVIDGLIENAIHEEQACCCGTCDVSPCEEGIYNPPVELPEGVMTFEETLKTFECCDLYCSDIEGACRVCPNRNVKDSNECGGMTRMVRSALYHLKNNANSKYVQPVELLEVVRCKDCKRFLQMETSPSYDGKCLGYGYLVEANHYCSYGERRNDDKEIQDNIQNGAKV